MNKQDLKFYTKQRIARLQNSILRVISAFPSDVEWDERQGRMGDMKQPTITKAKKMEQEDKVPSRELCQKLWELGITKDIETERIWHIPSRCHKWRIDNYKSTYGNTTDQKKDNYIDRSYLSYIKEIGRLIPSPDLYELGELLPDYLPGTDGGDPHCLMYNRQRSKKKKHRLHYWLNNPEVTADTEPNVKAEMLITLRENSRKI